MKFELKKLNISIIFQRILKIKFWGDVFCYFTFYIFLLLFSILTLLARKVTIKLNSALLKIYLSPNDVIVPKVATWGSTSNANNSKTRSPIGTKKLFSHPENISESFDTKLYFLTLLRTSYLITWLFRGQNDLEGGQILKSTTNIKDRSFCTLYFEPTPRSVAQHLLFQNCLWIFPRGIFSRFFTPDLCRVPWPKG